MGVIPYFGTYARFSALTKEHGMLLLSADCLVGSELKVVFDREGSNEDVWLETPFGKRCGKLDSAGAGQALLCRAKSWDIHALLASVFGTVEEEQGMTYWGEVVILAYPHSQAESFDRFTSGVASLLAEGIRPQIDLHQSSLSQIEQTGGSWLPGDRVPPLSVADSAVVKNRQTFNDRMIQLARERHPGCMAVGWGFIILLVIGAFLLVKWLAGL